MPSELHGKVATAALMTITTINDFINRALSNEVSHTITY